MAYNPFKPALQSPGNYRALDAMTNLLVPPQYMRQGKTRRWPYILVYFTGHGEHRPRYFHTSSQNEGKYREKENFLIICFAATEEDAKTLRRVYTQALHAHFKIAEELQKQNAETGFQQSKVEINPDHFLRMKKAASHEAPVVSKPEEPNV